MAFGFGAVGRAAAKMPGMKSVGKTVNKVPGVNPVASKLGMNPLQRNPQIQQPRPSPPIGPTQPPVPQTPQQANPMAQQGWGGMIGQMKNQMQPIAQQVGGAFNPGQTTMPMKPPMMYGGGYTGMGPGGFTPPMRNERMGPQMGSDMINPDGSGGFAGFPPGGPGPIRAMPSPMMEPNTLNMTDRGAVNTAPDFGPVAENAQAENAPMIGPSNEMATNWLRNRFGGGPMRRLM